jgi:hypothetical protein
MAKVSIVHYWLDGGSTWCVGIAEDSSDGQ